MSPRPISPATILSAASAARPAAMPDMARKVLVCVGNDGLPQEVMSELWARQASGTIEEVFLVAAWEPTEFSVGGDHVHRGLVSQVIDCVKRSMEAYLSSLVKDLTRHGISTEVLVLVGWHPGDIQSLAQHHGAQLLSIGGNQQLRMTCIPAARVWCRGPCPLGS